MTSLHRFTTLDGLRGIAALAVMFHHFDHTLFSNASVAVDLFFALSGFVIAYSYYNKLHADLSISTFIKKRFIRLYPMFLLGLILGGTALFVKFIHAQTDLTLIQIVSAFFLNIFYLPYLADFYVQIGTDKIPSAIFPINDPSWSLFFEMFVNILFPFIILFSKNAKFILTIVVLSAIGLVGYSLFTHTPTPGWGAKSFFGGIPRVFFSFFLGVFVFTIFNTIKAKFYNINPVVILLALFLLLSFPYSGKIWLASTILIVPLFIIFGSISTSENPYINNINEYLGWISYPLYCIHFPVLSLYSSFDIGYNIYLSTIICTVVSLFLSHLLAKYIDDPIRAKLSKKFI